MIGNDVIDLALSRVESNWRRRGFIEKIFTENEQKIIYLAQNQELMVWDLWSRKEAVYKIYNRQTRKRAFIPRQIECRTIASIKGKSFGKVVINDFEYYTITKVANEFIYTEAVVNLSDFGRIDAANPINIVKDEYGIPFSKLSLNPVSVTHHGEFKVSIQLNINT